MVCKKNKLGNRKSARFQIVSAISYKENFVVVLISHTIIILLVFIYLVIFFFTFATLHGKLSTPN